MRCLFLYKKLGGITMNTQLIVRTTVTLVAVLNQILVTNGWDVLPWSEDEIGQGISAALTVGAVAWSWWKNNNVTRVAKQHQVELDSKKESK